MSSTNDTTSFDTMFGRMAVDQRLCTEDELQRCQEEAKQRQASDPTSIEHLLIQHQFITKNQAHRLRSNIRDSKDTASQIPGYKVINKLGSGAMAVVYKAKQISSGPRGSRQGPA